MSHVVGGVVVQSKSDSQGAMTVIVSIGCVYKGTVTYTFVPLQHTGNTQCNTRCHTRCNTHTTWSGLSAADWCAYSCWGGERQRGTEVSPVASRFVTWFIHVHDAVNMFATVVI